MVKVNNQNPIIMVDDCDNNLHIARRYFARSNLQNPIITFQSGAELLSYMEDVQAYRAPMPALVLLDVEMPGGLSGLDTLRALRCKEEFAGKPSVIMFTLSHDPEHYKQAFALGADAYQQKPANGDAYLSFLNSLV